MDQKSLIYGCQKNEYSAQMLVYEQFKDKLFNASWRILKNDDDAKDIVHDTFITAFKNIHQLKGDMNLGGWLKRIAINKSIDFLKKRKIIDCNQDYESLEEQVLEEEQTINTTASITEIMDCINMLKEKYRVIVTLYLIEDYTHKEISQFLGINESTVRNQYARGRIELKRLIKLKI